MGKPFLAWLLSTVKCMKKESSRLFLSCPPPPQDDDIEVMSCIETEVIADFEADYIISHSALVSSYEELRQFDSLIFLREKSAVAP